MLKCKGGGDYNGSSRVLEFDFIRALACFAIVVTHAKSIFSQLEPHTAAWNAAIVSHSFTRMGVPLFVMISGYFLLSKTYRTDEDVVRFYKRRWLTIGVPGVFWATLYLILNAIKHFHSNATLAGFFPMIAHSFLQKGQVLTATPLWYLYMLVGLYLITPLAASWFSVFSRRYLTVMSFIFLCGVCLISTTTFVLYGTHMPATIFIRFVYYVPYFLLGKILGDVFANGSHPKAALLGFLGFALATAGIVITHFYFDGRAYLYEDLSSGNCSFLVICQALSFYIFALSWKSNPAFALPRLVTFLASLSFGVYLVHLPCLTVGKKLLSFVDLAPDPSRPIVTFAAYVLTAYALANFITFVFKRLPYLRRVV